MAHKSQFKSSYSPRRGSSRRRRQVFFQNFARIATVIAAVGVLGFLAYKGGSILLNRFPQKNEESTASGVLVESSNVVESTPASTTENSETPTIPETIIPTPDQLDMILAEANALSVGYDYEGAISLLEKCGFDDPDGKLAEAISSYREILSTLKPYNLAEVTHVFFHTLVMDESKAFDGEYTEKGYNQVMTTKDEFLKIMQTMYDRGFVLVGLHDMGEMEEVEGSMKMVKKQIFLPEGKKAFVLSQDDVCYYEYMEKDGFANRMVIGEDGYPTCEMKLDDGSTVTGSYDLVPLLEDFIQDHPDFSYKGARGVIAFTGYQGILGYRTAASYKDTNPTYEEDKKKAAEVAKCLQDHGWELASHSWGHRDLGNIEYSAFKTDCDKWQNEVASIIGPIDIILFPFGADIGSWHPYSSDNDRFQYLYKQGFRYFCNVDSSQYWVQVGSNYRRQGRRNLDGYRMWKDITAEEDGTTRKLEDLFHAEDVFSSNRPTPVLWN